MRRQCLETPACIPLAEVICLTPHHPIFSSNARTAPVPMLLVLQAISDGSWSISSSHPCRDVQQQACCCLVVLLHSHDSTRLHSQSVLLLMWHEACEFKQRLSSCNLLPARLLCAANMADKLMHFCVPGNFLEQMGACLCCITGLLNSLVPMDSICCMLHWGHGPVRQTPDHCLVPSDLKPCPGTTCYSHLMLVAWCH